MKNKTPCVSRIASNLVLEARVKATNARFGLLRNKKIRAFKILIKPKLPPLKGL